MTEPNEFPVHWEQPGDERLLWTADRVHVPAPLTPMSFDFARCSYEYGIVQAYELPVRVLLRRFNTYLYMAMVPLELPPEEIAAREQRTESRMHDAIWTLQADWTMRWLPEVKSHLAYWEQLDFAAASPSALFSILDETIQRTQRLWDIHFKVVQPALLALTLFDELHSELLGAAHAQGTHGLLRGFPNRTLEADHALWRLSEIARTSPIRAILEERHHGDEMTELELSQAGRDYLARVREYLTEYGKRSELPYELSFPSWCEDTSPVFRAIRDHLQHSARDPFELQPILAQEREELVAEAMQRLQGQPTEVKDRYNQLLRAAQQATVLHEDHNAWIDFQIAYHVRGLLLEFGRRLALAGTIGCVDDVFYLTVDELRATSITLPGTADLRSLVVDRRRQMEHFRAISPPAQLGASPVQPPPDAPLARALQRVFGAPPRGGTEPDLVRGIPGAPGVAVGPACVIRSLAEGEKLHPGDVLVIESAQPPWSSLFGIASAIVSDYGGALSHCAIVARDYGVPAVVGTRIATRVIRDGDMLKVDGSGGVVARLTVGPPDTSSAARSGSQIPNRVSR